MKDEFDDLLHIPDPYAHDAGAAPPAPRVTPAPTRGMLRAIRIASTAIGVAFSIAVLTVCGHRLSIHSPLALVAYGMVAPLLCGVLGLWLAARANLSRVQAIAITALTAVFFALSAYLTRADGDGTLRGCAECMWMGSWISLALFGVAAFASRHMFVTGAMRKTIVMGIACALLGAAVHRIHCDNDAFVHVLVGHGIPVMIVALCAALAARRITRA
jgi:hypothetical protein